MRKPILLLLPHEPLLLLPGNAAVGRWFWMPARAVPLVGWLEEDRGRVRAVHVDRLRERYGDWLANCQPDNFPDARGRVHPNRATPVATIEGIVEIVLLLTGTPPRYSVYDVIMLGQFETGKVRKSQEEWDSVLAGLGVPGRLGRPAGAPGQVGGWD